jgi:hypothetical protein
MGSTLAAQNEYSNLSTGIKMIELTKKLITLSNQKMSVAWGIPMSLMRDKNIVMFHMGRCGSTVLGDLLSQHSRIYWRGEIYYPYIREWRFQKQKISDSSNIRLKPDPLIALRQNMFIAGSKNYGCEIKFHHLYEAGISLSDFIEILKDKNFSFVVLKRKNFLRSIVSNAIMHNLPVKKTHNKIDEKPTARKALIDVNGVGYNGYKKSLIEHLDIYSRNYSEIYQKLADKNFLDLCFEEDISQDPKLAYKKVCDFLDVEYEKLPVRLSRTNPFPLSEMIENYQEVKEYLATTEYSWMCDSSI